ncbi:MAG: hypothetical protein KC910_14535 [Candidatus Eremiobacteraeota bacterium]|nr:hypothetical protein [Candidatus Eremiobacteraeota bacterium]
MSVIAEAWQELLSGPPPIYLSAAEIKARTGLEPRLMAKFDHSNQLPEGLARQGMFVLPVRNGHYVVLRGQGYHRLEPCPSPIEFPSRAEFALKTSERGQSEMQYLDLAYNSGILSHFLEEPTLYPTIRGRKRSPRFELSVAGQSLTVEGVQVEVDAGYEGPQMVAVFEAKLGEPEDFHLRQLYYPFRFWSQLTDKPVRPVFFTYCPEQAIYRLREYRFEPPQVYQSPMLVRAAAYRLVARPGRLADLPSTAPGRIPQADDLEKVAVLPFLVAAGHDTHEAMAAALDFSPRQSAYYRDAAEMLGLLEQSFQLSSRGRLFITLPVEARHELLCRSLLELEIMRQLVIEMLLSPSQSLGRDEVVRLVQRSAQLSASTAKRRCQTLFRWFGWLEKTMGFVRVEGPEVRLLVGRESVSSQLSLFS